LLRFSSVITTAIAAIVLGMPFGDAEISAPLPARNSDSGRTCCRLVLVLDAIGEADKEPPKPRFVFVAGQSYFFEYIWIQPKLAKGRLGSCIFRAEGSD